jgi:hypothetical protein
MADELDEFLKQAAQRRMQRQQQKQPQTPTPPKPRPNPQPEFSKPRPTVFEDNSPVADRSLEPSISDRHVTTQIDQADEGIDAYVRSTIGSPTNLGDLQNRPLQDKSQLKKQSEKKKSDNKSEERPTIHQRPNDIVGSSELIRQLRDPKTLRMAILAHEILRRPYQ